MRDKYVLFGEGPDDSNMLYHLLTRHGLSEPLTIKSGGGIEKLLATLPTELRLNSELERVGLVIDADTDLDARWMALQNVLQKTGTVDLPKTPEREGTIVSLDLPDRTLRVGVWIMPDNTLPGMLEDFISFLVPATDTLWPRAADCIAQIPADERLFPPQHQSKAHLHTWLAWQKEPGKPMGQAITKRFLDPDAPYAQTLIAWLRRLFDL